MNVETDTFQWKTRVETDVTMNVETDTLQWKTRVETDLLQCM